MSSHTRSATLADIKAAYKNFALKLHPDVTGNNEVCVCARVFHAMCLCVWAVDTNVYVCGCFMP